MDMRDQAPIDPWSTWGERRRGTVVMWMAFSGAVIGTGVTLLILRVQGELTDADLRNAWLLPLAAGGFAGVVVGTVVNWCAARLGSRGRLRSALLRGLIDGVAYLTGGALAVGWLVNGLPIDPIGPASATGIALAGLFLPAIWITLRQVREEASADAARRSSLASWIATSQTSDGPPAAAPPVIGDPATMFNPDLAPLATVPTERHRLFPAAAIETLGASARLAESFEAVNRGQPRSEQVAPASRLPASKTEIEAALIDLIRAETDQPRLMRLRGLYIDLARYGSDDDARFLDEYGDRRRHGPRMSKGEWDRANQMIKRSQELTRQANKRVFELRPAPTMSRLGSIGELVEGIGLLAVLLAVAYAVTVGYALLVANLVVRIERLEVASIVFGGAILTAPIAALAVWAVLVDLLVRVRRRDSPGRLGLLVNLVVPILWVLVIFGLAART